MAATPVAPEFLVGVVYDGAATLKLDFDPVDAVAPDANVGAFKTLVLQKIRPLPEFAHVTLTGQMFVYGPWQQTPKTAEWRAKLDDVDAALSRGASIRVGVTGAQAYFVVRVPSPGTSPLAAACGRACASGRVWGECVPRRPRVSVV